MQESEDILEKMGDNELTWLWNELQGFTVFSGSNNCPHCSSPQDCPAESGDFRDQQCSAHNDIKYQDVTYEWVPAPYDPSAPCALKCQAKGRSLTVELAPEVLDGTRCRADAFDMCISGVCQVKACAMIHTPPPPAMGQKWHQTMS